MRLEVESGAHRRDFHRARVVNVWLVSFLAAASVQVFHELVHGVVAMIVGGRFERLSIWAADTSLPEGIPGAVWREVLITGLAAVLNIVLAAISAWACSRIARKPIPRLFAFYVAAYSGFMGFGYLLVDPVFASEESVGDWARVTMILGGAWFVRLPIILVGLTGTIAGYFWMGKTAESFVEAPIEEGRERIRRGFLLCVFPYLVNNLLFTILAFWHPLGAVGLLLSLNQYWLGYGGFVWAFLIRFIWSQPTPAAVETTPLPTTVHYALGIAAISGFVAMLFFLK